MPGNNKLNQNPFSMVQKPEQTPVRLFDGGNNPFDTYRSSATDLKTPHGLFKMAQDAGLQNDAERVIKESGGESGKFLSGGFVMDGMDILNAFGYGMVGLVKGRGFIEGIKNRESLADDDSLGKYGFTGKVAGFVGDILLDPFTWISPLKVASKIPGVASTLEKANSKLLGELKTIEVDGQKTFKRDGGWTPLTFLSDKLVYGFAVGKEFLSGAERIAGRNDAMLGEADDIIRSVGKIDPEIFKRTMSTDVDGRLFSKTIGDLEIEMRREGLDKEFDIVSSLYTMRDSLMQRLVDLKVISQSTKEEHWGTYLKQTYDEFLSNKKPITTKSGITLENKARVEGLTPEIIKSLGQVDDAGVVWGTTLIKQIDLVKKAELQQYISNGYAMTSEMIDSFVKKGGALSDLHGVPNDPKRYGDLASKYVSKEIWNTLKGTFDPKTEFGEKLVMNFKHATVIWNPASQVRNAFSASIQNWWEMGLGPWRADVYYGALREFKDPQSRVINEMKSFGFNERSGYINELMYNYMTNNDLISKSVGSQIGGVKQIKKFGKHIDRLMMDSYAHIDNVAKVAAYKHGVSRGLSKEEAYARAVAATFDYSQVTPLVHQMRRAIWGVPFITFGLKAAPLVGRTLVNNPGRISVFGKARNDLFKAAGVEGEQEQQSLPSYMRDDMFVMKLPWKDSNGRSMYFDLSYIIPVGALLDGSYLKNPLQANPVLSLVSELSKNETFSGNKIFNESDDISTVVADISAHTLKMGLPGFIKDTIPDGYKKDGTRVPPRIGYEKFNKTNTQDLGPGERSFYQELFRQLGMSSTPYELNSKEASLAYEQRKNLTKLLEENGVLKTYQSSYLPKESKYRPENAGIQPESLYNRDVKPLGR